MALVKCPDCGKMVSPRAKVCPDCGCPSEYFEGVIRDEHVLNNVQKEETVEEYTEFVFKNNVIKYPKKAELFAGLFGDFTKIAFDKSKQLVTIYKNLGNADSIVKILQEKPKS